MRKNKLWLFWLAAGVFLTSGCEALLIVGAIGGTGAGTYHYVTGELQAEYNASFDQVWAACEKAMADLRALNVQPYKEIGRGKMSAVINAEDINLSVTYKEKNLTAVSIRVGIFGDKVASQRLRDKIGENIAKP